MRGKWLITLAIITIALAVFPGGTVFAVDNEEQQEGCGEEAQKGYGLCVGYDDLSIDGGGETLLPYRQLDSHALARAHYREPLWDGLLDLSFSYEGGDYYNFEGDFYGLTDTVIIRSQKFVKNLEHQNLPGPFNTSGSPLYWSQDLNPGDAYHMDQQENYASFKYKWHSYPANVSVAVRQYISEGEKQQLFLNENCTTSCHGVSQTRSVKTTTDQVFLSGTTHLGLVDVSFHYRGTQFTDDMPDPVYAFGSIPTYTDTRDVHNAYPDLDSSEHLLSVSTNHTGRFSGLLGLGAGDRENLESGASEKYQQLLGRFLWRPNMSVAVFLDSKQLYQQDDKPPTALQSARLADGAPLRYGSVLNRHRLTVNYYPVDILDLKGEFSITDTQREDNELWGLPDDTSSSEWRLTARIKPASKVKIKAAYTDRVTDNPAYQSSPTDSRKLLLSGQWIPSSGLCLEADLKDFADENTNSGQINDRKILGAAVTYTPPKPFSLAFRVYQFTNDISADLTFADTAPSPITDEDVPYTAEGTQYMLQAVWSASKKLQLTGQYSYLQAEGSFDADTTGFADVEDYSGLDATQQESFLDLEYTMSDGWGISARIAQLSYEDKESNLEDEDINEVSASVTRKW
jgi:hypothetical protein